MGFGDPPFKSLVILKYGNGKENGNYYHGRMEKNKLDEMESGLLGV